MGPTRTVSCPVCAATWSRGTARFCGRCGARLAVDAAPRRRRTRAWATPLITVLIIVAVGAAAAAGIATLDLPGGGDTTVVAVDRDGVVPEGRPLDEEARARLLEPFDQNVVRCAPRGCERWRVELPEGAEVTGYSELDGLFVVSQRHRMWSIDLDTGEQRWEALWPEQTTDLHDTWTMLLSDPTEGLVVAIRPERGEAMAVDADGGALWFRELPDGAVQAALVDGVLLVGGYAEPHMTERPPVQGIDARTGEVLWTRDLGGLVYSEGDRALVRDDERLYRIDPSTAEILASAPVPYKSWTHVYNGIVVAYGYEDREHTMYDPTTLEVLASFEDVDEVMPLPELGITLATRHIEGQDPSLADAQGDGRARLQVHELDGTLRWQYLPEAGDPVPSVCCPLPHLADGLLVLPSVTGGQTFSFDPDTGELVSLEESGGGWHTHAFVGDIRFEQRHDSLLVETPAGVIRVTGTGVWPVTHGEPVVVTNGRTLLALDPELGDNGP